MKRILFSLLIAVLSLGASAQSYWGVRAGWDGNFPGDWKVDDNSVKLFNNGSGLYAGAIYNYPIVGGLYVEPGAGIYYDTYRFDLVLAEDPYAGALVENPKVKKFGFRIPVRLGYYFDIFPQLGGISIFTGPQFDLGVSAKVGITEEESKKFEFSRDLYSDEHGYRRYNMSWTVGANIYVGPWVFDICGSFGLTDQHKSQVSFRENRLSIGLGYNF